MLFSSLLDLPFDASGSIDIDALKDVLPNTPDDVLAQVYSAHGRKPDFQDQYRNVAVGRLSWQQDRLAAEAIVSCSVYPEFQDWFNSVADRVQRFPTQGWACIDVRPEVRQHWGSSGSWLRPPVFIAGSVVGARRDLHLVEGHTRVGLLHGLVKAGVLPGSSQHSVWVGRDAA